MLLNDEYFLTIAKHSDTLEAKLKKQVFDDLSRQKLFDKKMKKRLKEAILDVYQAYKRELRISIYK